MLKESLYNHYVRFGQDENEPLLLFNALSCALIEITDPDFSLQKIIEDGDENTIKMMKEGNFLIDDESNELDYLQYLSTKSRFGRTALSLTILPTLDCNFACTYCYEEHKKIAMNNEMIEKIVHIVEQACKNGITSFFVEWYGGEPLLEIDTIQKLSETFMKLTKEHNIPYEAGMVSNGYLLNQENVKQLSAWKVKKIQITLDGPPKYHNKTRKHASDKDTFYPILNGVKLASEYMPVALRINATKTNIESLDELLHILVKNKIHTMNVSPYLGFIKATTKACKSSSGSCLTDEEFVLNNSEFIKKIDNLGFQNYSYPTPSFRLCGAVSENSFVIAPNGNLFKCWETIGMDSEVVGNIADNTMKPEHQNNFLKWLLFDPFRNQYCTKCNLFPICFGGCPSDHVVHHGEVLRSKDFSSCSSFKHELYFKQMMSIIHKKYKRGDFAKKQEKSESDKDKDDKQNTSEKSS